MRIYDDGAYSSKIQQLESQEELLKRRLSENSNTLTNEEMQELNNRLAGIRIEKGEMEQLSSGAFF